MFRDQLGSVRGVVEGTDWVERGVYRPFGESVEWVDPTEEPESHNYIGERRDETGLMYLNARYYDPALGHFLSPDWFPVTEPGVRVHRYGYAGFDPVNRLDPGGNVAPAVIGIIAIASWAFSAEGSNAPTPDDIQNDNLVQPGEGTARMVGVATAGATVTTLLPSYAARCALSPACRATSAFTEASECARTGICIPGAPGASSTSIGDDLVDWATSAGVRPTASNFSFIAQQDTGGQFRRFVTVDGTTIRINSGHAYNRVHAGGDVSMFGTMDEIENAILRDVVGNSRLRDLMPSTTQRNTVEVNGRMVEYTLADTPIGPNINYYPLME